MRRRFPILILSGLLFLLLVDSQCRITVSRYSMDSPSLPTNFPGLKIVQLSDLHGRKFGPDNRRLLRAVKREKPDIIAITGDMVDDTTDIPAMMSLLTDLSLLAPCYYITGNHEWAMGCTSELKTAVGATGTTVLDNRWVTLEFNSPPIVLVGVDDPNGSKDMIKPDALIQELRSQHPHNFVILLGHRNYWVKEYPALDADLILCGHAHGGLIRLPGLGGMFGTSRNLFPPHTEGLIQTERYSMIVSRGLGNSPGTFRLFNCPEIISVSIKKIVNLCLTISNSLL